MTGGHLPTRSAAHAEARDPSASLTTDQAPAEPEGRAPKPEQLAEPKAEAHNQ